MRRSIVIIGAGMGGLAAGIYGQRSGFATTGGGGGGGSAAAGGPVILNTPMPDEMHDAR